MATTRKAQARDIARRMRAAGVSWMLYVNPLKLRHQLIRGWLEQQGLNTKR
jgi:hypothetical protein